MSQQRQMREYQLVEMMLKDRQKLHAEFLRIMRDERGEGPLSDRDIIQAILDREFPVGQPSPHQ